MFQRTQILGTTVRTCKQSAEVTNSVLATPTDITGMSFTVIAGHRYWMKWGVGFKSAATTTGIGFVCSMPALTSGKWHADIQQGSTGTDQLFQQNSAFGSALVSASVVAADTEYSAWIEGFCQFSADGTVQLRTRTEVDASQITVVAGGAGFCVDLGA